MFSSHPHEIKKDISSNIWKIILIKFLSSFGIFMPIVVLFYQDNGLTMTQILLLQAIFSLSIFLFELPSGYFSDVLGRKRTIILAQFFDFIGFLIYSLSHGFWGFLCGELILGVGASFLSGTDSAMLYDTLIVIKKEDEYKKLEGRIQGFNYLALTIGSVFGGFLGAIQLRLPFFIQTFLSFISFLIAFTLIEPPIEKFKIENPLNDIFKILKYVMKNAEIKWLLVYAAIISSGVILLKWFIQPYFKLVGLRIEFFGIILALFNLFTVFVSLNAHSIESKIGKRNLLIGFPFLMFFAYLIMGLFPSLITIMLALIFYFIKGVGNPVMKAYINELVPSKIRATVLSIRNLLFRVIFSITSPFLGWIADVYSLTTALIFSGILFFIMSLIVLLLMFKHTKHLT